MKATIIPDKNKIMFSFKVRSKPLITKNTPSAMPIASLEKYARKNIVSPNPIDNKVSIKFEKLISFLIIATTTRATIA